VSSAYARLPLNTLRVYEAVASRLSFAEAAEALHVTPAAVSQQIKSLEDYLQVPLFKRSGRRVELTAEGMRLLPGVRRGLAELESALQQLKQDRAGGPLQISLLSSFLQHWLLPRLRDFHERHAGIELRLHTSREPVDFSRTEIHVAIRMGAGNYPGLYCEKLLDEWVVPVAAPAVVKKFGRLPRGSDLSKYPLLEGSDEPWRAWSDADGASKWLARAPIIDDSAGVLAAAEEGLGYALARWSLVARSLEQGRVQIAADNALPYQWSYYFVCPDAYLSMPKVLHFRDWLRVRAQEFRHPAEWNA
jgi:LysR family glycine cleavage system transcriptional activator